jgi:NAD(P) transhydrogenase subunit alpha
LFTQAGASVVAKPEVFKAAQLMAKVQKPNSDEVAAMSPATVIAALLSPLTQPDLAKQLAAAQVTALAMDMIPRITRAQKMDVLSSMANIAGYKAVLMAANLSTKFFPMMMTAAGTITPAKVLVLGVGVAGLQAIATAKRLGAVIEAYDPRPAVKEQVQSLGGTFLELQNLENIQDSGGYAKELSAADKEREKAMLREHILAADVVITTAQIPGKPAPVLVTADMVAAMKPGSVVVDLAAETGGNCALTEPGKTVVKHAVTIVGETNLPSLMASTASQLYSRNMLALIADITQDGKLTLNLDDEIIKGALITHLGQVVHPAVKEKL